MWYIEHLSPGARNRLVLVACILGSVIVFVDGTVVNVALPAIQDDLGGGLALQQWVVDAYLLTLGSLLLVGGSLGDLFGARRLFLIGIVLFGVTSVLCAAAPDGTTLILARGLQGVAGAILTPAGLAVIAATFRGEERGAAIGVLDGVDGYRIRDRPARRRLARHARVVALGVHHQRAVRDRDGRARPGGRAGAGAAGAAARRSTWSAACSACSASAAPCSR